MRVSGGGQSHRESAPDDSVASMASFVRDRQLETPAVLALEIIKPFGFLLSQMLLLSEPLLGETLRCRISSYRHVLEDPEEMTRLAALLTHETIAQAEEDPCQPSPS